MAKTDDVLKIIEHLTCTDPELEEMGRKSRSIRWLLSLSMRQELGQG